MSEDQTIDRCEILALTAEIVAAHVGNNAVAGAEVVALIQSVFDTLNGLATNEPAGAGELTPAVPIKRSVTDDYIVCLEDGKKLKMLKRHLMTDHGMTPEAYRAKWGLKPDYPMVAPNYSAQRQELAKQIGLGRKPANEKPFQPVPEAIRQLQEQLNQFRLTHARRSKLPEPLWTAAAALAREHGMYAVAHPLRLDYVGLKRRLAEHRPRPPRATLEAGVR